MSRAIQRVLLIVLCVAAALDARAHDVEQPGEMVTRPYKIPYRTEMLSSEQMQQSLQDLGVPFPEGASTRMAPSVRKLFITNTEENHAKVAFVLEELEIQSGLTQLEITMRLIEFEPDEIEKLVRAGFVELKDLMDLWESGKGKLISAPTVIAQNGEEAEVKIVEEFIYPTEYEAKLFGTNQSTLTIGAALTPSSFETREVGTLLNVIPEVSPSGDLVTLTLTPQCVSLSRLENYAITRAPVRGKGTDGRYSITQPIFAVDTVTTRVMLKDGETMILGGGTPHPQTGQVRYMLISVRLVDARGRPMKKRE